MWLAYVGRHASRAWNGMTCPALQIDMGVCMQSAQHAGKAWRALHACLPLSVAISWLLVSVDLPWILMLGSASLQGRRDGG